MADLLSNQDFESDPAGKENKTSKENALKTHTINSRREKLEEWRRKKEVDVPTKRVPTAKKESNTGVVSAKPPVKSGTVLKRKDKGSENADPSKSKAFQTLTVPKKDRSDTLGTNSRRSQFEEWKKKKESNKTTRNEPVTEKKPLKSNPLRRQTLSSGSAVNSQTRRSTFGISRGDNKPTRRQTIGAPKNDPIVDTKKPPTDASKMHSDHQRRNLSTGRNHLNIKKDNNANEKEQVEMSVANKRRTVSRDTVASSQRSRPASAVDSASNRRKTFDAQQTRQSIPQKHTNVKQPADKIHNTKEPWNQNRRQTFDAAKRTNERVRSVPSSGKESGKTTGDTEKKSEKKQKYIFVKSRIDTGLASVKTKPTSAKPPSGKPLPVNGGAIPKRPSRPISKLPTPRSTPAAERQRSTSKRRSCLVPSKRDSSPEKRRKTFSASSDHLNDSTSKIPVAVTPARAHVRFLSPRVELSGGSTKRAVTTPRPRTPASRDMAMRAKLNSWLTARGKTPTRFRHLMCFHDEQESPCKGAGDKVDGGLSELELSLQQETLERESLVGSFIQSPALAAGGEAAEDPVVKKLRCLLNECSLLLESGCPLENVQEWLRDIERQMPSALESAHYWILKAELVEREGGDNSAVIDVYEQAVRHSATPPGEVAEALAEFVKRMNSRKDRQPQHVKMSPLDEKVEKIDADRSEDARLVETERDEDEIINDDVFESTSIRYCMTQATPFFKKLRAKADGLPTPQAKITPVRRSTRKSVSSLPPMLRDHDLVLESLDDLTPGSKDKVIYQTNKALLEEFDAVAD